MPTKISLASVGRSTIIDLPTAMVNLRTCASGGIARTDGAGEEAAFLTVGTNTGDWAMAGIPDARRIARALQIAGTPVRIEQVTSGRPIGLIDCHPG